MVKIQNLLHVKPKILCNTICCNEIWLLDQSNTYYYDMNINNSININDGNHNIITTNNLNCGGTFYIIEKHDVIKITLDENFVNWVINKTGQSIPPVRPHWIGFNQSKTHAIICFVGSGHVLIMNAKTKEFIDVFLISGTMGAAHAAYTSHDDSYFLVTNFTNKSVYKVLSNYTTNQFIIDNTATLNLTSLNSGNPITAIISDNNQYGYVTLSGGGYLQIDPNSTPMSILNQYNNSQVVPAGLISLQYKNNIYFDSGVGTGTTSANYQSALYTINANQWPAEPCKIFDRTTVNGFDAHGMLMVGPYLWVADRGSKDIYVVCGKTLVNIIRFDVPGKLAIDLLAKNDKYVFGSLRGPIPLTGNNSTLNNAVGDYPGVAVIKIKQCGKSGKLKYIWRTYNIVNNIETSDPHGIDSR